MPSARPTVATRRAMRPNPNRPSVRPSSSIPGGAAGTTAERSAHPLMSLVTASSRAMVCSAVETVGASGAKHTAMPRAVAASTSTVSYPTPVREITRSRGARSIAAPSQRRLPAITASAPARSPSSGPTTTARPSSSSTTPSGTTRSKKNTGAASSGIVHNVPNRDDTGRDPCLGGMRPAIRDDPRPEPPRRPTRLLGSRRTASGRAEVDQLLVGGLDVVAQPAGSSMATGSMNRPMANWPA